MSYTSIIFLYFFLPAFMGLYAVVKAPYRPLIMSLGSSIVIGWASPWALIPMGLNVLLTYFCGIIIFNRTQKQKAAGPVLAVFIVTVLGELVL